MRGVCAYGLLYPYVQYTILENMHIYADGLHRYVAYVTNCNQVSLKLQ